MTNDTCIISGQPFVQVDCRIADIIRFDERVRVVSSLTDLDGMFGRPEVFSEWAFHREGHADLVALREHRWPEDDRPCEHWVPAPGFDFGAYDRHRWRIGDNEG